MKQIIEEIDMKIQKVIFVFALIFTLSAMTSCGNSNYDMDKYKSYKENGELSDAVHEWIRVYIEDYCTAQRDGTIECR